MPIEIRDDGTSRVLDLALEPGPARLTGWFVVIIGIHMFFSTVPKLEARILGGTLSRSYS